MGWNELLNNQMVSFTDAQGGGFTLNAGQNNVNSNQCMTKAEALTKYSLNASFMDSYTDSQLVPKILWTNLPVTGLAWSTTKNTVGFSGCESAGWVITNNNSTIRFNVAPSLNCVSGGCEITQIATATATITVGLTATNLNISWSGMGEAESTGFDQMSFVLNGATVSSGDAPGGGFGCTDAPIVQTIIIPGPYLLPANTVHILELSFSTVDPAYHINSYYEANISFT